MLIISVVLCLTTVLLGGKLGLTEREVVAILAAIVVTSFGLFAYDMLGELMGWWTTVYQA